MAIDLTRAEQVQHRDALANRAHLCHVAATVEDILSNFVAQVEDQSKQ